MQRKAHQHKAATRTGLTVAQIDALITTYEDRRTRIEYRHEQREELSAAKRDMANYTDLDAKLVLCHFAHREDRGLCTGARDRHKIR